MRILFTLLLCWLLFPTGLAQAGPTFPAVIPFEWIYYVTPPSTNGDALVVGRMSDVSAYINLLSLLPVPGSPNELFADASIQLAPGQYFTGVYVPTAREKAGDFSSFSGTLIDPLVNKPFPINNVIPASRLPDPFAFRIQAVPEPGIAMLTLLGLTSLVLRRLRT